MQKVTTATTLVSTLLVAHHTGPAPQRATRGAAAWDLWCTGLVSEGETFAAPPELHVMPGGMVTVTTGVCLEFSTVAQEWLYYADVRLRSGHRGRGLTMNGDAIIDCDYTGEIILKIWNVKPTRVTIDTTQPIAQMLVCCAPFSSLVPLVATERAHGNAGGFGSTSRHENVGHECTCTSQRGSDGVLTTTINVACKRHGDNESVRATRELHRDTEPR